MDCVVEACIPPRHPSSHQPRSPSASNCGGGGCGSDNSHQSSPSSSSSSGSAGAATCVVVDADVEKPRQSCFHSHPPEPQVPSNQDSHAAQFNKYLSLSTCGGSASNLTTLGNTNTATSLTSTSEETTPLSGASSHQQQVIRAKAERVVQEANHFRHSLDSRSSSHGRELDNVDDEEQREAVPLLHSQHSAHDQQDEEATSAAAAVTVASNPNNNTSASHHFASRSTPSSKRPRQQQQQQTSSEQQNNASTFTAGQTATAACAMHIPDPTTFADSSSTRHNTPMTASNVSPLPDGAASVPNGNDNMPTAPTATTTALRVHDVVSYEGEIDRAVRGAVSNGSSQQQQQQRLAFSQNEEQTIIQQGQQHPPPPPHVYARRHGERDAEAVVPPSHPTFVTTHTAVMVPTMPAGSHSATHTVAPDATPQEPPPKRFATGEAESMEDLGYAVMTSNNHNAHTREPSSVDEQRISENEEGERRRHASVRRHRHAALTKPEEEEENEDEAQFSSSSTSNTRAGERKGSTASRRTAGNGHGQKDKEGREKDKEGRRKNRLTNGSGLMGGRYSNDSITAGIPYDPTRFNTPPLAQQPQQQQQLQRSVEDSPFAQSASSAGAKSEAMRHHSESQPSCATPPEPQPKQKPSQQQQQQQQQTFQPPPTKPSIKLTESRYAFLALSFMMRMLCKLHKGEPIPSSDFHSHCIPPMSVTMYVQRLVRYCACSGEALLCAFLLLLKYVFHSGHPITIYNAHRLLITSIVLGIKLRDDVYYSNVYYGRIGGISGREMNKLEVLFLSKLDWETQVHEDEYEALLALLDDIAIEADPTPAQLDAFAAAFPEKVAAYTPDEDDDELEEAAAKLQQGTTATSSTSTSTLTNAAAVAGASVALTPAEATRRKTLRGAYRLHQWHTLVEPWMAQLQTHVFARKAENAQVAAQAWQEEGQRWETYYREDEEAAAQLQRESSASAWLSPLSVQKRVTPAANTAHNNNSSSNGNAVSGTYNYGSSSSNNHNNASNGAAAWNAEPPYQSTWPQADAISHHSGMNGTSAYATQASQQQQQPSSESNPRYSNFINFANVVTGGYFGPSSTNTQQQQQHFGIGGSHRASSGSSGNGAAAAMRYHTATDRPQRPLSATFDITNRATSAQTTTAAAAAGFGEGSAVATGPHSENNSRHSAMSAHTLSQAQQQQGFPTVAGTTARAGSPTSSTTPGSGINVNAQPYYYVSSRMRRQQQQQQQQQQSTAAVREASPSSTEHSPARVGDVTTTTTATTHNASALHNSNDPCSSSSSFCSPACVNPPARFSNYPSTAPNNNNNNSSTSNNSHSVTPSTQSGMEAVLAAMKRGATTTSTSATAVPASTLVDGMTNKVVSHVDACENSGSSVTASHTFPARPLAKGVGSGNGGAGGHEGEQATAAHVPRRSPQSAHTVAAHRRSTYASQHSLGKKRSKPDSYKDY